MAIENLIETLKILSDGNSYSGEEIGKRLGIGRAAIWKIISQLREKGLQIESVKGQGYKLLDNVEMLDENTIKADLKDNSFDEIITLNQTASTNSYLSSQFTDSTKNLACIAENQTGGRGRNNRSWISPFARSIAMSVRWHFQTLPSGISGLSLAVGIAVANAMHNIGIENAMVKWPNDIYINNSKLAGILIEISGEISGPCSVIIGIGINLQLTEEEKSQIDQSCTAIYEHTQQRIGRNRIIAELLNSIAAVMSIFADKGFSSLLTQWQKYDLLKNREVTLITHNNQENGVALGVSKDGALQVTVNGEERLFYSGDVSLRLK